MRTYRIPGCGDIEIRNTRSIRTPYRATAILDQIPLSSGAAAPTRSAAVASLMHEIRAQGHSIPSILMEFYELMCARDTLNAMVRRRFM